MPSESIEHNILVTQGEAYIRRVYSDVRMLSTDSFSYLGTGRILPFQQYQPDIVAELIGGRIIIGEAKTINDILRPHSKEQYKAFIIYLSQQSTNGIFLIFCSWKVATSAQDWLRNFFRCHPDIDITCVVVSDVEIKRKLHGSTY